MSQPFRRISPAAELVEAERSIEAEKAVIRRWAAQFETRTAYLSSDARRRLTPKEREYVETLLPSHLTESHGVV